MTPKLFTFNFDVKPAKKLRDAVNEKQKLSIEKEHKIWDCKNKKDVSYFAWDRICAIMNRVEDTLDYLNSMELGNCRSRQSAFDFYDFINNAYVVIEGIKIIGQIFALDNAKIDSIEKSQEAFGDVLNAGGTDGQFFSYIRSLCAVHPFYTTKHPVYMKDSVLHCCPFVVWSHCGIASLWSDKRDLSVHYIRYLKHEYNKRFGDSMEYVFDKFAFIFEIKLTNEENAKKLEKYKNAIRYALTFMCNGMGKMQFEGFEYTGIQEDNYSQIELFFEIESPAVFSDEISKHQYNLSKVHYLDEDYYGDYDKMWARKLLDQPKDFLNKYIVFTNEEPDREVVILVSLAIYLHALEQNCILNRNIPNELSYREKLLSEEEISSFKQNNGEANKPLEKVVIKTRGSDGNVLDEFEIEAYSK